jgi:hypothetical protein
MLTPPKFSEIVRSRTKVAGVHHPSGPVDPPTRLREAHRLARIWRGLEDGGGGGQVETTRPRGQRVDPRGSGACHDLMHGTSHIGIAIGSRDRGSDKTLPSKLSQTFASFFPFAWLHACAVSDTQACGVCHSFVLQLATAVKASHSFYCVFHPTQGLSYRLNSLTGIF